MTDSWTPGWYPAPDAPGERWWNGVGWSDARRGGTTPAAPPSPAAPSPVAPTLPAPVPVVYSASNPAPQQPGQFAPPGAPGYAPRAAMTIDARQNPMSVYALVAGIISFFANILLVPSILAVVFGLRALGRSKEIAASGQVDRTRGLAVAGLILGVVGGAFGLFQGLLFVIGFLPMIFFQY